MEMELERGSFVVGDLPHGQTLNGTPEGEKTSRQSLDGIINTGLGSELEEYVALHAKQREAEEGDGERRSLSPYTLAELESFAETRSRCLESMECLAGGEDSLGEPHQWREPSMRTVTPENSGPWRTSPQPYSDGPPTLTWTRSQLDHRDPNNNSEYRSGLDQSPPYLTAYHQLPPVCLPPVTRAPTSQGNTTGDFEVGYKAYAREYPAQKRVRIPPYPVHVRRAVVSLRSQGMKQRDIADRLQISVNTVFRVLDRFKKTGQITQVSPPGGTAKKPRRSPTKSPQSKTGAAESEDAKPQPGLVAGSSDGVPGSEADDKLQEAAKTLTSLGDAMPGAGSPAEDESDLVPDSGCQQDLEFSSSPDYGLTPSPEDQELTAPVFGQGRARTKRTAFSKECLAAFEEVFNRSHFPSSLVKAEMSCRFGVPTKNITTWFCNRRSRFKREKSTMFPIASAPKVPISPYSPRDYQPQRKQPPTAAPQGNTSSWGPSDVPYGYVCAPQNPASRPPAPARDVPEGCPQGGAYTGGHPGMYYSLPPYWPYHYLQHYGGWGTYPPHKPQSGPVEPLGRPSYSSTPAPHGGPVQGPAQGSPQGGPEEAWVPPTSVCQQYVDISPVKEKHSSIKEERPVLLG